MNNTLNFISFNIKRPAEFIQVYKNDNVNYIPELIALTLSRSPFFNSPHYSHAPIGSHDFSIVTNNVRQRKRYII